MYEKLDTLNQVAEFHKTFKHPILDTPQIPSEKRCLLRVNLLKEEVQELSDAIGDENIVAVADVLCDIQYVLSGAVLEFGLAEKFPQLFNEVQRSNMSKACKDLEEAKLTQESCDVPTEIIEFEGKILVQKISDSKTVKSVGYSPANLESILEN